ncbi:uncharacterized protein ACA1_376660 [Acanthamoeba castellanii str. Neff]|uniref:Uncharacterized protein n=1 Tax=Acanthamoeba castellanii (strain ATCC 30010 / Neff) TaxID=1257118 RepID=L8HG17_ACACF|nr:uncharacterized protein ACA1_376660 [Acanthamoeba castellanii str. Neff]ELR24192.1 hypothetical protein ACA1_376660 [Acanthamoeba castellanii str. Neff]
MAHHGYMKYQDHISVAECEPCPYHVCHRAYIQVADDDGDAEYMCACAACWWSSWRLGDMLTGFLCTPWHEWCDWDWCLCACCGLQ